MIPYNIIIKIINYIIKIQGIRIVDRIDNVKLTVCRIQSCFTCGNVGANDQNIE